MFSVLSFTPRMLLLFSFLFTRFTYAQSIDTLTLAKQVMAKKEFAEAEGLLKSYYEKHPGNLNAQWLYAQAAYSSKHFKKAQAIYENAIQWHPENYTLRLDYAKKLVDMGELEKAIPLLNLYLAYDSAATDVHEALAKISFWKAEYKTALAEAGKVLSKQPGNKSMYNLQNEILQAKSPWLKAKADYAADDQPFRKITPSMETGVSLNPLANLKLSFQSPLFIVDKKFYNAQWLVAGNKMLFSKYGMELNAEGGIIKLPDNKISGTASLQLNKAMIKHLIFSALADHQPYLSTRSNMKNPVMRLHYAFAAVWNTENSWQGKVAYDITHFYTDKNFINTASGWLITPPVKISAFDFRLGYGYNFSNAQNSRFVSEKTVGDVVAGWNTDTRIPGIYNPYFTPNHQSIHSAIIALNIHPSKFLEIGIKSNVCFSGTTNNPYLYLIKDVYNNIVIARGYSKLTFFPVEVSAYIAAHLTPRIIFKCEYSYTHNNFYSSHYAGLSLKVSFWNEK